MKSITSKLLLILIAMGSLNAEQWSYSLGLSDMMVRDAKPLESAPDGDDSHTVGLSLGIYGQSDKDSFIQQKGYFKIFIDNDKDHLDPDHIPIWLLANYEAKVPFSSYKSIIFSGVFDADTKINTVSSIEREFKFFTGLSSKYENTFLQTEIKALLGRYALEIDDDVAKKRGYSRSDLKKVSYGYSLGADARFVLSKNWGLTAGVQTWQAAGELLENQYKLEADYNTDDWIKNSKLIVSFVETQYNFDNYHTETLPMLPWEEDSLFQAFMVIPF